MELQKRPIKLRSLFISPQKMFFFFLEYNWKPSICLILYIMLKTTYYFEKNKVWWPGSVVKPNSHNQISLDNLQKA